MAKISILGAGSWGTALAEVQARLGHSIQLWDRNPEILQTIQTQRRNPKYHPKISLSKKIHPEENFFKAVQLSEIIILAIPSNAFRPYLKKLKPFLKKNIPLVCAAKGLEADTLKTLSMVSSEILGKEWVQKNYCVLSGPSFAHEVVQKLVTAVSLACTNLETAKKVQQVCHSETFQIFTTDDVIGVELGGALKNVIAIAAGASDGFGFGQNARAALISRGLSEISRIGKKLGAHPLTFLGLAGLGDLVLTCAGDLSRNRHFGMLLAQGKSLRIALREVGQVVEGMRTAKAAYQLASSFHLTVPILEAIYLTLYKGKSLQQAIQDILSRAPQDERE